MNTINFDKRTYVGIALTFSIPLVLFSFGFDAYVLLSDAAGLLFTAAIALLLLLGAIQVMQR